MGVLTLSLRSSTILRRGPGVVPTKVEDRVSGALDILCFAMSPSLNADGGIDSLGGSRGGIYSGVDATDSPSAAVEGKNREAMTTLWLRNELIVKHDDIRN